MPRVRGRNLRGVSRAAWIAVAISLSLVILGLLATIRDASVPGGWFGAPESTLWSDLRLIVLGSLLLQIGSAWVVTSGLTFRLTREAIGPVFVVLSAASIFVLAALSSGLGELGFALTAIVWTTVAVILILAVGPKLYPNASAVVVTLIATVIVLLLAWWGFAHSGLLHVAGPGEVTPEAIRDGATFFYHYPVISLLIPGLPTVTLVALAFATLLATARQRVRADNAQAVRSRQP